MEVNVNPGHLLGPFFSKLVEDRLGEDATWLTTSRLLIQSATIGAAFREHGRIKIDDSVLGVAATKQLPVRRRVRVDVYQNLHKELYDYLSQEGLNRAEAVIFLAEVYAANQLGALQFINAKGNLTVESTFAKTRVGGTNASHDMSSPTSGGSGGDKHTDELPSATGHHDVSESDPISGSQETSLPAVSTTIDKAVKRTEEEPTPKAADNSEGDLSKVKEKPDREHKESDREIEKAEQDDTFAFLTEMAKKSH